MRAPFVLGAFVFCSAACAQDFSSSPRSTNAPAADSSEIRQNVRAEVQVRGNNGKGVGNTVSEAAKLLHRKLPPNRRGPKAPPGKPRPGPKAEPTERPRPTREMREELIEQRANLRMERVRLQARELIAVVKEEAILERRKLE